MNNKNHFTLSPLVTLSLVLSITALEGFTPNANAQDGKVNNDKVQRWVEDGQATLKARKTVKPNKRRAKNVILFIADGMDPTTVAAARIYDGQTRGEEGEENFLSFEKFPYLAMSKTYNTNAQTPDSAGTMSAMVTGVKTKSGVISLTDNVTTENCASVANAGIQTIAELAEQIGMATGIVSTARLTHATPAAVYAHSASRNWENDSELTQEAVENGCIDIAQQLIEFPYGDGLEVAMGGGRRNFLPTTMTDPENKKRTGAREDERNLTTEWSEKSSAHQWVWNKTQFDQIDPNTNPKILGLFERSHMQYELDRTQKGTPKEPSLAEMTAKAIEILSNDKDGFFLMVEAGRVDHAHHGGNAARALHDAQMFSQAIATALEMTNQKDTLIIATADHGHTLAFQGYPIKGNNILGLVKPPYKRFEAEDGLTHASDGKPYTTLTYANGPGSILTKDDHEEDGHDESDHSEGRARLTPAIVAEKDFQQQAAIPLGSETHGGQDVTIYANGPHAYLFGGVVEQSYIFHVMEEALSLKKKVAKKNKRNK